MDFNKTNNFEILNGDNYTTWRIWITHLLKKEKLWKIVIGEELKPTSTTWANGTITNPPETGAGSIFEWEDRDEAPTSLLIENVKNICLGHLHLLEIIEQNFKNSFEIKMLWINVIYKENMLILKWLMAKILPIIFILSNCC